jgi:hypothetical protein
VDVHSCPLRYAYVTPMEHSRTDLHGAGVLGLSVGRPCTLTLQLRALLLLHWVRNGPNRAAAPRNMSYNSLGIADAATYTN